MSEENHTFENSGQQSGVSLNKESGIRPAVECKSTETDGAAGIRPAGGI